MQILSVNERISYSPDIFYFSQQLLHVANVSPTKTVSLNAAIFSLLFIQHYDYSSGIPYEETNSFNVSGYRSFSSI